MREFGRVAALGGDGVLLKYVTAKVSARLLRHWLVDVVSQGFELSRVI